MFYTRVKGPGIYHVTLVKCSSLNMVYGPGTAIVYWLFKPMYGSFRTHLTDEFETQDFCYTLLLETSTTDFCSRCLHRGFPIVYRGSWQRRTLRFSSRRRTTLAVVSDDGLWTIVHASYIVFHWLYTAVYISSHKWHCVCLRMGMIYRWAHHWSVYNAYYRSRCG